MKKVLLILLVIYFTNCANAQKNSDKYHVLTITKGKVVTKGNDVFWETPATLSNTSKDTLHYMSMSCSWQDFYTINTKKLDIQVGDCDKNVPQHLSIPPNKSTTVVLSLMVKHPKENIPLKFKIGYDLILIADDKHWLTYNDNVNERKIVIWSNEIIMP